MRKRLRSTSAAVRRWAGYVPLRVPGVVFAVAIVFVWWFSDRHADYLLYPAAIVALETTHIVRTGFAFPRLAIWPLVEVRMQWDEPGSIEVVCDIAGKTFEETIIAKERGRYTRIVRRFTVEDIFGLTALTFRKTYEQKLRIVPIRCTQGPEVIVGHATGDAFSHPLGKAEGDLVEMRRYGHGDPLRHILWKTFARTRRLLVRMPERAVSPMPTTSAFLIAGEGDEPAAATARLYVETGLLGDDFVFAADGAHTPTGEPAEAVDQIIDSIAKRAEGGAGLEMFRRGVEPVRLGHCIVFAPPSDGAWTERVAAFSRTLPAPATIIIGIEGKTMPPRRRRIARWLLGRAPTIGHVHPDLASVRAKLEAGGMQVKVLHRETGQVLA